jgi:putative Mg2+ transporter-C (MgtC) family protein
MLHWYDFLLRLSVALLGGALIGLERQWRSRGTGQRTNTLVAAGAAMFVLTSHMTPCGSNPTQARFGRL